MQRPDGDIEGCRLAHARLVAIVGSLDEREMRRPSLLPQWDVGHVLTHLARNAESMCQRIDAAARGELVQQYPGGAAGRAAVIEKGAVRPADEIVADTETWAKRLDEAFATVRGETWAQPVRTVQGDEHPVAELPFRRWREVEVHLVDLGVNYTSAEWPQEFVDRVLPSLLARLHNRTDTRELVAWLFGRGGPPTLAAWG